MCGIAGIIRFTSKQVTTYEIKSLTNIINHRGPDGEGCWLHQEQFLGLGHRRLSILDLSEQGAQPMHYADGNLSIVYNGEIFNFLEIRNELKAKGYIFNTDSDTEVLLASFHYWGKDCLDHFNGFWAFALWDDQNKELWLARDRFGEKPLYYMNQTGLQFVFGSETLQFKHIEGFKREANSASVSYLIQDPWGLEGLGKTIFSQVEQLRPGHHLTVRPDGSLETIQWWNTAEHLQEVPQDFELQAKEFLSLFQDAIRLRLRSDVSIASALSGGLDSSAVYCTIHHIMEQKKELYRLPTDWQRAFVAVFPGTGQDERLYAEEVLSHTSGKGVFFDMNTGGDLAQRLLDSITSYDTIYSTPLFIMDGLYGGMRANGITVSMDGHGVDEMMYGYPNSALQALEYARTLTNKEYIADLTDISLSMLTEEKRRQKIMELSNKPSNFLQRQIARVAGKFSSSKSDLSWFEPDHISGIQLPVCKAPENMNPAEALLYNTFHFTVLPTILRNFDLGSMRKSIEIRMPFLDHRLVTYLFSLPMESKIGSGFTKRILRAAMKGILPETIRTRKLKTGFNAPLQSWYNKELKTLLLDTVTEKKFQESSYFNGKVVNRFVEQRLTKGNWSEPDAFRLWPVINAHLLLK